MFTIEPWHIVALLSVLVVAALVWLAWASELK
jgi:hypothetical protein